jgi:hypothetical protein
MAVYTSSEAICTYRADPSIEVHSPGPVVASLHRSNYTHLVLFFSVFSHLLRLAFVSLCALLPHDTLSHYPQAMSCLEQGSRPAGVHFSLSLPPGQSTLLGSVSKSHLLIRLFVNRRGETRTHTRQPPPRLMTR